MTNNNQIDTTQSDIAKLDTLSVSSIVKQFAITDDIDNITEFGDGNINDTFLIETTEDNEKYILQKINSHVFVRPDLVMNNMSIVINHIDNKRQAQSQVANIWQVPTIIQTLDKKDYLTVNQTYWRMMRFIPNSLSFNTIDNDDIAKEVGMALGLFHKMIADISTDTLADTLEGFHITPQYLADYQAVSQDYQHASSAYQKEVQYCLDYINDKRSSISVLERAKASGELTVRVMHGDPKVNNILFDKTTHKAISLIDLDTVKAGLIHYDIGDCIRSGCNTLGEEAGDRWQLVDFDMDKCEAILEGYLTQAYEFLTEADYQYLYDAIFIISFELGLRFFTDFIRGNQYFKVDYPEHNLHRALVQFKLAERIEANQSQINQLIDSLKQSLSQ